MRLEFLLHSYQETLEEPNFLMVLEGLKVESWLLAGITTTFHGLSLERIKSPLVKTIFKDQKAGKSILA